MTNDNVIRIESINNNNIIDLKFEGLKTGKIKLDRNRRYIHSFRDEGFDITVVEILDEDIISKKSLLELQLDIPINNNLIIMEYIIPNILLKKKNSKKEKE